MTPTTNSRCRKKYVLLGWPPRPGAPGTCPIGPMVNPAPSVCRHCDQNTSTLFKKTPEAITDQHSTNSLTEQCSLNIHGYGEWTTRMETGLNSAKYQSNHYKACSSENALTRTTESLWCHQSRSQAIHHTGSHTDSPIYSVHKYQQYLTEEIAEHNATNPDRESKETRPMILEQTT